MVNIIFLGTNGWYDTATGNTSCVYVETEDLHIILDAGSGFYKVKDIIKSDKPVILFISHLHLDHIIGLHTLPLFRFPQGIDIYTPKLMDKAMRGFLKRPFTSPPVLLPTKLRFHSLDEKSRFPFKLDIRRLRHSVLCYGYRLEFKDSIVSYCTDTGDCANLIRLASKADLLITECAMSPGDKAPNLFHITPETAARVAANAMAGRLALFHFDPGKYPSFVSRATAENAARKIFDNTIAAVDGTVITL